MGDVPPTTGQKPKDLAENLVFLCQAVVLPQTEENFVSTPPLQSDLDDEQIRALLASPLYLQEREASADRSQVYHSARENLVSSSSKIPKSTGKPVALFSSKRKSSQEAFLDREVFSSEHQQVPGNNEPLFRFSYLETSIKSFTEEHICLQKQNLMCESMKAEQIISTVLFVIFRDNLIPIVWKSILPIQGVEEFRKEQARLHEELAQR